jgi:hypothetical protein
MTPLKALCKTCKEEKFLAMMCMTQKDVCVDCRKKKQKENRIKYYGHPSNERHPDYFKKG